MLYLYWGEGEWGCNILRRYVWIFEPIASHYTGHVIHTNLWHAKCLLYMYLIGPCLDGPNVETCSKIGNFRAVNNLRYTNIAYVRNSNKINHLAICLQTTVSYRAMYSQSSWKIRSRVIELSLRPITTIKTFTVHSPPRYR